MATFGSELVAGIIVAELATVEDVTDAVGSRMHGTTFVPQGGALPALLTYAENSTYPDSGLFSNLDMEQLRVVVRLICQGTSTQPILDAALAQREALHGFVIEQDGYHITFLAIGAVPLTTLQDGGVVYRQLGTVYSVEITTGG
jgi:hypothetical protein